MHSVKSQISRKKRTNQWKWIGSLGYCFCCWVSSSSLYPDVMIWFSRDLIGSDRALKEASETAESPPLTVAVVLPLHEFIQSFHVVVYTELALDFGEQ